MIVIEPPQDSTLATPLSRRELQRFLSLAKKAVPVRGAVSVLLASDTAIRDLNRRFRRQNKTTDVLSFAAGQSSRPGRVAGDLAISLEAAERQAVEFGHSLEVEVEVLLLHGLLHLAGLDHEADRGEMAARERELRKELGLPVGLIERVSGGAGSKKRALARPPLAKRAKDGAPVPGRPLSSRGAKPRVGQ